MGTKNTTLLVAVVIIILGAIYYLEPKTPATSPVSSVAVTPVHSQSEAGLSRRAEKAKQFKMAKEIVNPSGFINTQDNKPISIQSLVGKKIILLDIWTYSCINCQRTFPYLKDWYAKYKDKGLEIIGLHAPEFDFEKDYGNVSSAVKKFGITWPVVLDNDFSTARSYGMRYWPEEYLIDIDGFIVHKSVGEGGYAETEMKIQELLSERMKVLGESGEVAEPISKFDSGSLSQVGSPETYFGSARNGYLGNGVSGQSGEKVFTLPSEFQSNKLYLGGRWNVRNEYAETVSAQTEIVFKYKARNVYFVARAVSNDIVTVLRDGKPLRAEKGADISVVGGESQTTIGESRLYKLIENDDGEEHTLRLIISKPGLQAYTFTFG